ncbi:hypothetical protein Mal4_49010 [Maioricimonas rarisocia]|uniref:DUF2203 domain-containing protein n=1 Tax=Maioricimonas rarisocia TaxID=2528026 RepID=A0A517ZDH5_9PLAN|nr:DUF2203 domain-containing protein [Maioricimonas rarisocia]QDU40543.1 hypothetical protein Mal4_49010 [Maioricimonas rarisocia]
MNSPATPNKKYFTPEEANRTLPLVRAIVKDIVSLAGDLDRRRERLESVRKKVSSRRERDRDDPYEEEVRQMEQELKQDDRRLDEYRHELTSLGAELKDEYVGLVDFRSRMEDRDVYLCWKLGEEEIGFWHELEAGVAGRVSLLEESVAGPDSDLEGEPEA